MDVIDNCCLHTSYFQLHFIFSTSLHTSDFTLSTSYSVIAWRPLSDDPSGRREDSGCKACHARAIGRRRRPSDNRRGAGRIQGARHAMHVRLGGRPSSDNRRGVKRPGVIAWRPLSDVRRGAGGDSGCKACHARAIAWRP